MKRQTVTLLILVILTFVNAAGAAQTIVASDGAAGDHFGTAVANAGNLVVAGAPNAVVDGNAGQGAAYVFVRWRGTWLELAKLTAGDGAPDDAFGASVAVAMGRIFVGAPNAAANGQSRLGAVYVFEKHFGMWHQVAKLSASDGMTGNAFGSSVAAYGGTLLAGAPFAAVNYGPPGNILQGAAYVFTLDRGWGSWRGWRHSGEWLETAKIAADDAHIFDQFGFSVALSNRTMLIGAVQQADFVGAAYVFNKNGMQWLQSGKLVPGPAAHNSQIGHSVAVANHLLVVGAINSSTADTLLSGVVYVYKKHAGGWLLADELTASDWSAGAHFGEAVSLLGRWLAIGAPRVNKVYLFVRDHNGRWTEAAMLAPPGGANGYGDALALSRRVLAVGYPTADVNGETGQGAVYLYNVPGDF